MSCFFVAQIKIENENYIKKKLKSFMSLRRVLKITSFSVWKKF